MDTRAALIDALKPLAKTVAGLDLSSPDAATMHLNATHDPTEIDALGALMNTALQEGWLTPQQASTTLNFGRIAKPSPEWHAMSVDVVDISGAGMEHTHPKGEVSLCFALHGNPRFDGHEAGWVVYGPDSHHTPTVTGGRMLIVYFQPEGAVKWGPRS